MTFHPLDGAFERVNRARKHLAELESEILGFSQIYHNSIGIKFEPNPPYKPSFDHKFILAPPPIIGVLIGEICYNLRAALDYLVYELARFDSGTIQNGTQFPIEEKFLGRIPTFLKGVSPAHVAAIKALQPYNGCKWTHTLSEISNPDKHRQLTVANYGGTITFGPVEDRFLGMGGRVDSIRRAIRPDGIEVQMHLVSAISIQIGVEKNRMMLECPSMFSIENALRKLIAEVADLLEAFKPKFQVSGGHSAPPPQPGT
ncbi:MAG: hypothetical protein ACLP7P_08745 [Rhodomicrobium sp.]